MFKEYGLYLTLLIAGLGCIVLAGFNFTGCAGQTQDVTMQQYQSLDLAADLRIAILKGAGDFYKQGIIDEETKAKILKIDKSVQAAGKFATKQLKKVSMLDQLKAIKPDAVGSEEYLAAMTAYNESKVAFRDEWAKMIDLVNPWIMKWIQ